MDTRPAGSEAFRYAAGAAWLNLLATVGSAFGAEPIERLDRPDRLAEWLGHERLAPTRPPGAGDLADARELREAIRPLALAAADRVPVASTDLDAFNAVAGRLTAGELEPVRLEAGTGTYPLATGPPASARGALHRLVRSAADDLTGPRAAQLRACEDPTCRMVYLDPTGRRRWCSTAICGNRARVRAHRQRARAIGDRSPENSA